MLQLAQNIQKTASLHLVQPRRDYYPQKIRALAVFYLPLTTMFQKISYEECLKAAKNKIRASNTSHLMSVAIDHWDSTNSNSLKLLSELFDWPEVCLIPVGPSTGEVLKTVESEKKLRNFLKNLSAAGINSIEGGNDLNCLEHAATEKFTLRPSFAVNIQEGFTDALAERIYKVEELARLTNRVETFTVFPHKRFFEFGSPALKAKSIEKYLNILRNCRKIAPSIPYLRAPISAFGNVMPEELAIKEVNDFGHFAINQETAIALGLEQLNHNYQSLFL